MKDSKGRPTRKALALKRWKCKDKDSMKKKGLYANIHAKRKRIKAGSGEKMRKVGSKGSPTAKAFRKSAKNCEEEMTLDKAVKALQFNTEWKVILDALRKDREALINDFHSPEILDNPQALARLGGEIASVDRIIKSFTNETD